MISILIVEQPGPGSRLQDCLRSIAQKTSLAYEVVLVEAGPETGPGSGAESSGVRPPVKLLRASGLTFAAAANLAAQHTTGEYLLLLSSDAVLLTDIADAVTVLESDPSIGAVGAEKYSHAGEHRVSCARFPAPRRLWRFSSMWHIPTETWRYVGAVPVRLCDYVDRSFLLTRADAWRAAGGMDATNQHYGDEMDFCRALLDLGLPTVHCPTVKYAHGGEYSPGRLGHLIGGFRRYHRRFSGPWTRLHAEIALRGGLALRLPFYWLKSRRGDAEARLALRHTLALYRGSSDSASP